MYALLSHLFVDCTLSLYCSECTNVAGFEYGHHEVLCYLLSSLDIFPDPHPCT